MPAVSSLGRSQWRGYKALGMENAIIVPGVFWVLDRGVVLAT